MTVAIEIEESRRGDMSGVPVLANHVSFAIEQEELGGVVKMVECDGKDAGDAVREAAEEENAAGPVRGFIALSCSCGDGVADRT